MAKTIRTYVSNGSQVVYPIDFDLGYLRREFVYVYTGEDYQTQLSYTWLNSAQIQLASPVTSGEELYIRRVVPRDVLINDYEDGAILKEKNLDDSFLQPLMIVEEIQDGYSDPDGTFDILGNLNMNSGLIQNLGVATQAHEAVRKDYVDAADALKYDKTGGAISGDVSIGGTLDMTNGRVRNLMSPAHPSDAANGYYVIEGLATKVSKSGDSMSGNLDMSSNRVTNVATPVSGQDVANKDYADLHVKKSGDSMTGNLSMSDNRITTVGTPLDATDVAHKQYVDSTALAVANSVHGGKVDRAGDTMEGGLNVVDAVSTLSAMTKNSIMAAIDRAVREATGPAPADEDYGLISAVATDFRDYGSL